MGGRLGPRACGCFPVAASAESQRRGSNPDVASLGHLGNVDADDAVQDALLPALTHVDQLKGRAQMSTWLTTIVINSARMKLRRRLSQVQVALDEPWASRIFP